MKGFVNGEVKTFISRHDKLFPMKEQITTCILPPLPIVGILKLSTRDGKTVSNIEVVKAKPTDCSLKVFKMAHKELSNYLTGKSTKLELPLDFSELSPFQVKVLKAMARIPYGKVATYKDLALKLNSKAYQAIGSACGRNPFMVVYPCHRVVGSNDLGGFAHGLEMKKQLLNLEGYKV